MFAEPTINDFLALIDWHISRALDRAGRAVGAQRSAAAGRGTLNSSVAIRLTIEAMRKEFDSGVDAVFGELKRVIRMPSKLDPGELRQHAVQRLTNFAIAARALTDFGNLHFGMGDYVKKQFADMDAHIQFMARQFDVGFFNPAEPEVPTVPNNSIHIGTMTGSTIQQGSPGAKQNVEFKIERDAVNNALTELETALKGVEVPGDKLDELLADVRTIRAQLAKPSPTRAIVQEAGRSLRNVLEGIGAGVLTPAVVAAAATLGKILGLG